MLSFISRSPPESPLCVFLRKKCLPAKSVFLLAQVLQLQLEERELELEQARADGGAIAAGGPADAREVKLKELAKRSKTATMALGRERAQNAQLAAELASVRRQLAEASAGSGGGGENCGGSSAGAATAADSTREQLKETKERLANSEKRLHDQKVVQQTLKAELERYKRALAKEVGEDAPLSKLLEEGSGAKGRAQQISLLQEKVREMTRKLSAATGGIEGGRAAEEAAERGPRNNLQAIEQDRRNEMDRLLLREQQLHADLNEARHKLEAQAARIKNLEADGRSKREKLKLLLDKSDTDDQLVKALRTELNKALSKGGSGQASPSKAGGQHGIGGAAEVERRVQELSAFVSQQQSQISRQEQIILALKDELAERKAENNGTLGSENKQDLAAKNGKLRELVHLLQQKVAELERR